jgi:hypothetical protein
VISLVVDPAVALQPAERVAARRTSPASRNAPLLAVGQTFACVELPAHLRYLGEPLTSGELNQLRGGGLDRTMVVAWCVFSVLFVSILASTVWLLRVVGA